MGSQSSLERIIKFYLACLEEEDLQTLSRPILFRSYLSFNTRKELKKILEDKNLNIADRTSLGIFLERKIEFKESGSDNIIEVEPLNKEQREAVWESFSRSLNLITAPPGTGKEKIIINLFTNALFRNKTVLYVSNNTKSLSMLKNHMEKILGNNAPLIFFFSASEKLNELKKTKIDYWQQISKSKNDELDSEVENILKKMSEIDGEIKDIKKIQQNISEEFSKLQKIMEECRKLEQMIPENWISAERRFDSFDDEYIFFEEEIGELKRLKEKNKGCIEKLITLFSPRFFINKHLEVIYSNIGRVNPQIRADFELLKRKESPLALLCEFVEKILIYIEWCRLNKELQNLYDKIEEKEETESLIDRIDNLEREKNGLAKEYLNVIVKGHIVRTAGDLDFLIKNYFDSLELKLEDDENENLTEHFCNTFIKLTSIFPIWMCQMRSVGRYIPFKENIFDLLVIDDANEVDFSTAIPLIFRSKSVVVIGDPCQTIFLNLLPKKKEVEIAKNLDASDLLPEWSYTKKSVYDIARRVYFANNKKPIILLENFDSHPEIAEIVNKTIYAGSLIYRSDIRSLEERFGRIKLGLFWHDVKGSVVNEQKSAANEREVEAIVQLLKRWESSELLSNKDLTMAIVTPFQLQMRKIIEALKKHNLFESMRDRIKVGTVHRLQREKADIVLFSVVLTKGIDSKKMWWITGREHLLNIAFMHAVGALHVFGDIDFCKNCSGFIGEVARYAEKCKEQRIDSERFDSIAEEKFAALLDSCGLWYLPQYPDSGYKLDFFVVSPLGLRYDIEIDGRQHLTDAQIEHDKRRDEVLAKKCYKILRIPARDVLINPEKVKNILKRI